MKSLEKWLKESTQKYNTLSAKNQELAEQMSDLTPEEILTFCQEIQTLQESIAESDEKMYELMNFAGPESLDLSETGEYQRALDKAIRASDHVASKARLYKQLIQEELSKLHDGKKMITGYNTTQQNYSGSLLHKEL